jgi:hypothetical protein
MHTNHLQIIILKLTYLQIVRIQGQEHNKHKHVYHVRFEILKHEK